MLSQREYPKTCCPSEVARGLSVNELEAIDCESWRDAMAPIREEAWRMKIDGLLDITQKGEVVKEVELDLIKGPIRLRSKPTGQLTIQVSELNMASAQMARNLRRAISSV